jgi:hypothetical protein
MSWKELELCFNRALAFSCSKKKLFLVFPVLVMCGIMMVFCRALAYEASNWIAMSLSFLPIFLASGVLLSLGVLIIRVYHFEVKQLKIDYKRILKNSWELIAGTIYLSLPPILAYLLLWIIFGMFVFLKQIPQIGNYMGVFLSFGPFILILGSLLLVIFNLALLFFVAPAIAFNSKEKYKLAGKIFSKLAQNVFTNLVFFAVALFPIFIVVIILSLAAILTGINYLVASHSLSVGLEWFFIMIPFCMILTPCVIFFFNFAAETYNLHFLKTKN